MQQLAFIAVVEFEGGVERKLPAADIADVRELAHGAMITMRDGRRIETTTTAADIYTAINTLWTNYLTALGDPA